MKQIFNKISPAYVIVTMLIITDLIGLALTKNVQANLTTLQSAVQWQQKLQEENVSPSVIQDASKIDAAFTSEPEVIQFITNLNKYRNQFEKFTLNFEGVRTKNPDLKYLPVILEISGNKDKFIELLNRLWKSSYVTEITGLEMKKNLQTNQTSILLKMNLYVRDNYGEE